MIKDLPIQDKPREKALKYGVNNLTDSELIAIILRTGAISASALDVAREILKQVELVENLNLLSINKLSKIKGVGEVKAITLLAALELGRRSYQISHQKPIKVNSALVIFEYFKYLLIKEKQENFIVVFLDNQKNIITYKTVFIGSLNYLSVHPREIFKEAIVRSSASVILVHNHPSGMATPSKVDIETTERLIKTGDLLQIPVIDHIIIANDKYYSFYDNGLMK
ncbi:MAG: DNA repair protein RadC [Bacilli bacterium]|nr:DNA repair protein RadC [Bacilli bacterium]